MNLKEKYPSLSYDKFSQMSMPELKETFEWAVRQMQETPITFIYDKEQVASLVHLYRTMYQLMIAIQKKSA